MHVDVHAFASIGSGSVLRPAKDVDLDWETLELSSSLRGKGGGGIQIHTIRTCFSQHTYVLRQNPEM